MLSLSKISNMSSVILILLVNTTTTIYFHILRYNGGTVFDKLGTGPQYGHYQAGNNLGQYNHGLVVVGGLSSVSSSSAHSEVEILDKEKGSLKWKEMQKYPFHSR